MLHVRRSVEYGIIDAKLGGVYSVRETQKGDFSFNTIGFRYSRNDNGYLQPKLSASNHFRFAIFTWNTSSPVGLYSMAGNGLAWEGQVIAGFRFQRKRCEILE